MFSPRSRRRAALPSTINLVTGPSRTGDIEQTMELGAHGPKALAVLVVNIKKIVLPAEGGAG